MYVCDHDHDDIDGIMHVPPGADNPSIELCTQIIQRYETTAEGKEQVSLINL